jgi:hypothetical protein
VSKLTPLGITRVMPACRIQNEQRDCTGADTLTDAGQMGVHGLDIDTRHDHGCAGATGRADGAEQIGPGEPPIPLEPWSSAAFGPQTGQRALLANPSFILEPDLDRAACMGGGNGRAGLGGEVF